MADSCSNPKANGQVGESHLPDISPSKIFNYYKLSRYNRLIDSIIGDIFRNHVDELGWTIKDLENPNNLRRVYKGVKQYITNMLIDKYKDVPGEWQRLTDYIAIDLDTIVENFEVFADEHVRYSEIFNTVAFDVNEETAPDDESAPEEGKDGGLEDEDDDEVDLKNSKWDEKTGNSESQVDIAASPIRTIFRLISKAKYNPLTKAGETSYDSEGLPQPAEFSKTWNLLAERLAGEKDYQTFVDILKSDKTKKIIPEVDQIIDILKINKPDKDKSYSEVIQFIQFWQTFSKPKIPLQSSQFGPAEQGDVTNSYSIYDEILGNRKKLEIIFNNNFATNNIPEDYKQYIKRSDTGVYLLDRTSEADNMYIPPMDGSFESQLKFLNFLGFQFTFLNLIDPKELEKFKQTVSFSAQRLYASVKERLESDEQIKFPLDQLRKKSGKIRGENKSIRDLIEWESQYSQIAPTHSSRTAAGELQYLINNDSALSIANYHLNAAKTLNDLFKSPPFRTSKFNPLFKSSWAINFLFDESGNKREGRTIDLNLLSGFKIKEGKKVTSQLERNLSERNKLIQDYNMFLTVGRTDTIRTETSRSFFSVGMYDGGNPVNMLEPRGFSTGFDNYRGFKSQILKYLNGEISRIQSYSKKKQENPSLPKGYGDFSLFSDISQALKDKLKVSSALDLDSPLFKEFFSEYDKVLNREVSLFKQILAANNITSKELLSKQLLDGESVETLHKAFIAGTILQSIEFTILYAGDPLFYENESKDISEMAKRMKGLASTGSVAADLSLIRTYFQGDHEKNYNERYSLANALGVTKRDNTETYLTQTLVEPVSTKSGYTSPSLVTNMRKSWQMRDGKSISAAEVTALISDGSKIKVADGQGWINPDFYRELAIRFGFITPQMETVLKYEGLIFKRDFAGKTLSDDEQRELQILEKAIYSEPEKHSLPVIKGTYWGPIVNSTVDGKAYDKFSIAPILPSYARTKPALKSFLIDMVKKGYGYVKYQSGTKAFSSSPVSTLADAKPDEFATQLFKEQIKTKSSQSTEASLLTQEVKLAFTNMFNQGVGQSERIQNLYNKFVSSFKEIQKEQRERVGKDLGMTIDESEKKYEITDPSKLSAKLIREVKRRGGDSDLIKALTINPSTGNFNGTLDSSGFQKEINQLVSGILDRTLRRYKFAGGDFVMVSNHMQSPLNWYQFSEKGVRPMDIRITLTKEYSKLLNKLHPDDGERIGTLSRLNKLLQSEEWRKENEKALTVMFGRAPVDAPHSTGIGIIKEFLPPTMANTIILPDEVVFQGSFDFDYDKQRVITPYLDEKGNYLTSSPEQRLEQIMEKIGELQDIYPELERLRSMEKGYVKDEEFIEESSSQFINNLFNTDSRKEIFLANREAKSLMDEYFELTRNISSLKNNRVIELFTEATLLPEMYGELVSPNNTLHIKDIALKNGENTQSSIALPRLGRNMYYTEQLKIFKTFFDNKNLLAAFASDNTFQQLLTYAGVDMNEVFNTKKASWAPWKRTKINNLLLSEEEYNKVVKDGKILTSLREDIDQYFKQMWNSEALNATVDSAKDPFTVLLKMLLQNIGVVNVMKHIGIPFNRIVDFVSHPSLQYYFKLRESGMTQALAIEKLNRDRLFLRTNSSRERAVIDKQEYNDLMTLPKEKLIELKILKPGEDFQITKVGNDYNVKISSIVYPNSYNIQDILTQIENREKIDKNGFQKEGDLINLNKYLSYAPITPERFKAISSPDNDRLFVREDNARKDEMAQIYSDELRVVAHFFALEKVSWAMRDFRNYFNFDTKKTSTLTDVTSKVKLREKILAQNLFGAEAVSNMEKNTIHGSYMNDDLISAIFRKIFPIIANPTVLAIFSDLADDYNNNYQIRNKRDMRNLPFVINNDFISSILFNYGEFEGRNIFDRGFALLIRQGKEGVTMADKLQTFKKQPFYNELRRTYPILDLLVSNKQSFQEEGDPNGLPTSFLLENIQLIKNDQETAVEREGIREQFRDIYYNYTGKNAAEVKEFLNDLFITGIVQSGFNKSFISFAEYIPYDFKQPLTFGAMKQLSKLTGNQLAGYMEVFGEQFRNNNPRYFPKLRRQSAKGVVNIPNVVKYSTRFKYYRQNKAPQPLQGAKTEKVTPKAEPVVAQVKIISGGQTGIDRLGLEVAKALGLQTGGTAPKGFKTAVGKDLTLKELGLKEHASSTYGPRTEQNLLDADGTIIFSREFLQEKDTTVKAIRKLEAEGHKISFIYNPESWQIQQFIKGKAVINIAGNRASKLTAEQITDFGETLKQGLHIPQDNTSSPDDSQDDDNQTDAGGQDLNLKCD